MSKEKKFMSCFICGVEIDDEKIVLEDSSHKFYFIPKNDQTLDVVENFKMWFEHVYKKGIPASMTIIDYSIGENKDRESIRIVNKLVSPLMTQKAESNG